MKTILSAMILFLLAVLCLTQFSSAQDKKLDGKTIFVDKKCSGCHGIEAAGLLKKSTGKTGPPDLSTVGSKHDAVWMAKFVQKNEALNEKKHMIKFNGSDDELKALTQWLASLKGGGKKATK